MALEHKARVLVVDDEADIRASLKMILEYEGMRMIEAASGPEALDRVRDDDPDAVLLDIKMPRVDGLEVLAQLGKTRPDLPVVMISGHGTISTAVEATRLGAFDFMEKPLERDRVLLVLRNALERRRLVQTVREYRLSFEERFRLVGGSDSLAQIEQAIARIAPTKASVLITGESGTGKELLARAIHGNSTRADKPFVKVNCAAIPEELIESELFGHVRGSFTGATKDQAGKFVRADGGTIFLDEVGDMSLKTQAKVLRVLQDGDVEPVGAAATLTVDVRVVAATNKDLPVEIEAGNFREDLYFRLNVVPLHLPPLRERSEDVPPLVEYFAKSYCRDNNYREKRFTRAALAALSRLPWRGNVRELRNAVERLIIMTPSDTIDEANLPAGLGLALGGPHGSVVTSAAGSLVIPHRGVGLQEFKDRAERAYLEAQLEANDWNIAATAKAIGTPRSNLYKKLEAYGLGREKDGRR
ncbi:MAG TPA: sigma-54 dependent transcriptional regulator [Candidatus Polarisedimenticolaceae bacterium]|nr:sigma-54 dependent transcriptional regulator [Candidatus Polarisedimenticolaceae bacterium]